MCIRDRTSFENELDPSVVAYAIVAVMLNWHAGHFPKLTVAVLVPSAMVSLLASQDSAQVGGRGVKDLPLRSLSLIHI